MQNFTNLNLHKLISNNASLFEIDKQHFCLSIQPGSQKSYRVAQLDDYSPFARRSFPWSPPLRLHLHARITTPQVQGTWGFGFWNDPFSLSLGFGGGVRKFPVLPEAVWFFFASKPNHLTLIDDLPGHGNMAMTYTSKKIHPLLLVLTTTFVPILAIPGINRKLRKLLSKIMRQDAFLINQDPTCWHQYQIDWLPCSVVYYIDNEPVFESNLSPKPPLGLVLWIDNQYMAFPPDGKLAFGVLPTIEETSLEIKALRISIPPIESQIPIS
jgi:hypothetical protein